MAKNQKKETAKKEETSDNKNMLNIIHWIITVILLGAVAWLCATFRIHRYNYLKQKNKYSYGT